jgi:hypothetical protein
MKNRLLLITATVIFLLLAITSVPATVITNNLAISPVDMSYEGADLVISNCTVTMDGAHSFSSLFVAAGGVVTHSYLSNGSTTLLFNAVDEPQVLNGTNPVTLAKSNVVSIFSVTDSGHTITYTNDLDYVQTNLVDGTTQIYRTDTSSIPDGSTVLVTYTWSYSYSAGLVVNVTNDLNVANGGSLNANNVGYGPALGSGRGFSSTGIIVEGSGASHAGRGGNCSSNALISASYGTLYQPVTLGSGGGASYAGSGGNGGGRIQITVGGTLNIDGVITVNGMDATNARAGGGAGGSVWITVNNFSGGGSLIANGGAGEPIHGGGGGGGRISIQCGTNNFSGSFSAIGGTGWKAGGAGTVFTQTNGDVGLLVLDNGGHSGTNTTVNLFTTADVIVRNGAWLTPSSFSPRHLTLGTNGVLSPASAAQLSLTVSGNFTIQAGGVLLADFLGAAPGTGNAPGGFAFSNYYCGGGGGHGGYGALGNASGANGGGTYATQTAPTALGSGGGNNASAIGGYGGGAFQLNVTGTLQVDGRISVNGGNGSMSGGNGGGGGGGSGGSIYIPFCAALTGSGSITADGGNGVALFGGGGGGGRIAINAGNNSFTGNLSAAGGGGFAYGGAGTIYTQFGGVQQLTVDNAGHLGTNTAVSALNAAALIVRNGAKVTASQALTFSSLLVTSNA